MSPSLPWDEGGRSHVVRLTMLPRVRMMWCQQILDEATSDFDRFGAKELLVLSKLEIDAAEHSMMERRDE